MEIPIFNDIIIIFALAVFVLFLCHKLKIPSIVGFLLTGILAGPHGLALVKSVEQVEIIAELGVVLLLFSIGLEFSFKSLMEIKKTVLLGGSVQVGLSIFLTFAIARLTGIPINQAVFLGFLVSLSSTAIVLKQLGERAELDTPHGKIDLGILIYQDIIVVAMMLFTPLLGSGEVVAEPIGSVLLKIVLVILLVILLANYIIPPLLYHITRTQSRELFLLSIILICFFVGWLTSSAGLSLALGAFLAGLIIAESEYSHQALGNIIPFLDTFTSLFFVSIGMLLNIGSLLDYWGIILLLTLGLLGMKCMVGALATIILGYPLRTAIMVGFALCQVGEFSFILAQTGMEFNIIGGSLYQGFLSASILSMMLTPFLISMAPRIAQLCCSMPLPERLRSGIYPWITEMESPGGLEDHLLIIGYGINGKNLARAAKFAGIPYAILEINAKTVREEKEKGEPIYFGDAGQEIVLSNLNVQAARIAVVAISDPVAARRVTALLRRMQPSIHIIVRIRFISDVSDLHQLGANEVIPEEYETSVEIFARVLAKYMLPRDEIEEFIDQVRKEDYEMFRNISRRATKFSHINYSLANLDISTLKVKEGSRLVDKSLLEIDLRKEYGVSVLAIRRGSKTIANPGAEEYIYTDDYIVVLGTTEEIRNLAHIMV